MTPEAHARELAESLWDTTVVYRGDWEAQIAGAIRAAENDALERAAHRAEAFDQNVADAIREMKHPN